MKFEGIEATLMALPPDFEGILFVESGNIELDQLQYIQTTAKVMVVLCRDVESIKLIEIPWRKKV